jgi:hypothetical protein
MTQLQAIKYAYQFDSMWFVLLILGVGARHWAEVVTDESNETFLSVPAVNLFASSNLQDTLLFIEAGRFPGLAQQCCAVDNQLQLTGVSIS